MQFSQILKDYKNPIFKLFKRIIKIHFSNFLRHYKNPKFIKKRITRILKLLKWSKRIQIQKKFSTFLNFQKDYKSPIFQKF